MEDSCPFCEIVAGRSDARLVHEWPYALAFFPLDPATIGHTLVIPKVHVASIWDLEKSLGRILSDCVLETVAAVGSQLKPDGLNLINSAGEVATQTVGHLHIHILPRYANDRMQLVWPESAVADDSILREAQSRVSSGFIS